MCIQLVSDTEVKVICMSLIYTHNDSKFSVAALLDIHKTWKGTKTGFEWAYTFKKNWNWILSELCAKNIQNVIFGDSAFWESLFKKIPDIYVWQDTPKWIMPTGLFKKQEKRLSIISIYYKIGRRCSAESHCN